MFAPLPLAYLCRCSHPPSKISQITHLLFHFRQFRFQESLTGRFRPNQIVNEAIHVLGRYVEIVQKHLRRAIVSAPRPEAYTGR